jgi:hypothetical protein
MANAVNHLKSILATPWNEKNKESDGTLRHPFIAMPRAREAFGCL